jgi:hypothetical protein
MRTGQKHGLTTQGNDEELSGPRHRARKKVAGSEGSRKLAMKDGEIHGL